jgi:SAM-dependent methyltransferase
LLSSSSFWSSTNLTYNKVHHSKNMHVGALSQLILLTRNPLRWQSLSCLEASRQSNFDGLRITQQLHKSIADGDQEVIEFQGYVSSKRSFGNALAFVDLISYPELDTCQALLRQEFYLGLHYQGYRKSILSGACLYLEGNAAPTRNPGEAVLMIHRMQILQLPRQPQHIRAIISMVASGELPLEEVAEASLISADLFKKSLIQEQGNRKPYNELVQLIMSTLPPLSMDLELSITNKLKLSPTKFVDPPHQVSMNVSSVKETLSVQEVATLTSPRAVATVGFVQNRRRFENNVTIAILVDALNPLSIDREDVGMVDMTRLECILHPDIFNAATMYGNLLTVGSGVWVSGFLVASEEEGRSTALWVKEARLVRASWRPITLRYILDMLYEGELPVDETAQALRISIAEAEEIAALDDLTARQWRANQLSANLQSAQSRAGSLSPEVMMILDQKCRLRTRWPLRATPGTQIEPSSSLQRGSPGSRWQRKKRPQLEWMVREITEIIKAHGDYGKRTLNILDVGGGKGKLANYLAQSLKVHVHVVDIAQGAINNGAMQSKRLNLTVNYQLADASTTQFLDQPIDIVVALHACGHLSDVSLAHAIQHQAGFVICPCCFLSNPGLRIPGTGETVEEFLRIPSAEWSALKCLAEVQGDFSLSSQAIHEICAVRAEAVSQKVRNCEIEIKSFPVQYSTRNLCLVGRIKG